MTKIYTGELPQNALPIQYRDAGAHTDCYYVDISEQVALEELIQAFYTTPLFKVERAILSVFARKPSSDIDVRELSLAHSDKFSIWTVESRLANQILLRDFTHKTRSWLMTSPAETNDVLNTRLYFGSVVVPKEKSTNGSKSFGVLFHLLGGFHRLYSRALLKSAVKKLMTKGC